jgi:Ca2+-transporting ATPase
MLAASVGDRGDARNDARRRTWHEQPLREVLSTLGTTADGLSSTDANARRAVVGPNALPRARPTAWWVVLGAQLTSVVVLLLVAGAIVAAVTGDIADAVAIAAVLLLNVSLGFAVEIRAHRAIEALERLEARMATVRRDGILKELDAHELVPGDVIALDAGQAVPADARVLSGSELHTAEAALTGEPVPVSKRAEADIGVNAPLAERHNCVYAGTTVASGSGLAVVVATGVHTELGRIGVLVGATRVEKTPLERQLDELGRGLVWIALAVGVVTAGVAWAQHTPTARVIQAAIALAVAAVPEGLPAVATITLALGVRRMARRRALVRRLTSVETLGSVTVLCTDKTGTLTAGAMTVTELRTSDRTYRVEGTGYAPEGEFVVNGAAIDPATDSDLMLALRIGATASRADAVLTERGWIPRGDPTEAALVVAARKAGIERADVVKDFPEAGQVPFSSERKLMATFHRGRGDRLVAYVKGAPQRILTLCEHRRSGGVVRPLRPARRAALVEANRDMAERGLRVLALAQGPAERAEESALQRLVFVALVGITDPPASGVKDAIDVFGRAGIRTVMMTGDQAGTARAIARDLGLAAAESLDGRQVDAMSDVSLQQALSRTTVFSRISPEAKLRLVAAYQHRGDIVAMIGDGVNDAAALKKADVGVTMGGRGTDVARETAAVVLEDDRFETIGVAIEEGRAVFDNIRKFVYYLFSCNLAEIFVMFGSSAAGLPLPLEPIQILWLNLVTDTAPALALAVEPAEPGILRRPPRHPAEMIVSRAFLRRAAGYAALIAIPVFAVMVWARWADVPADRVLTMNFMVLALAQVFHLGNARDDRPVLRIERALANRLALAAVAGVIILQILTASIAPLAELLHVQPLTRIEWLVVFVAASTPGVVGQGIKVWRAHSGGGS